MNKHHERYIVFMFPATPWTVALQAPLSMEFSMQEYWSGFSFPSPRDLPNPRIEPQSLKLPALADRFFTNSATWEAPQFSSVAQLCPTLCNPMDCSPPSSSVRGILRARRLEWVAISSSRGSSRPRNQTRSPALQADSLPSEPCLI